MLTTEKGSPMFDSKFNFIFQPSKKGICIIHIKKRTFLINNEQNRQWKELIYMKYSILTQIGQQHMANQENRTLLFFFSNGGRGFRPVGAGYSSKLLTKGLLHH